MAFEDNQLEPALPGGNKNYKRKVKNHLPKYTNLRPKKIMVLQRFKDLYTGYHKKYEI